MLKPYNNRTIEYLITGTGRCGSVYMARLLTSLGIPCSHEAIFNYMGLEYAKKNLSSFMPPKNSHCSTYDLLKEKPIENWIDTKKMRAESSYMAAPYLCDSMFDSTKVIHVVRHPLKVIGSHTNDINFFDPNTTNTVLWLNFVLEQMPELKEVKNKIEKACYYYVHWNGMIESKIKQKKYMLHKVENGCDQSLLDFIEVKNTSNVFTDSTVNSWKKRESDITLDEIPEGSIKKDFVAIGERYGYF